MEDRRVFLAPRSIDQELVEPPDPRRHRRLPCSAVGNQRSLQQRRQQRRAHALAGDVRHHQPPSSCAVTPTHRSSRRPPARCHAAAAGAQPAVRRQPARQQALLDRPRHRFSSSSIRCLRAFLFQQARVFEHRRSLDRQRLQQLAVAPRQVGRGACANPCRARPPSRRSVDSRLVASPSAVRMRTSGTQITLRSSRSATLCCGPSRCCPAGRSSSRAARGGVRSARCSTSRGTCRFVLVQVAPVAVARHPHFQFVALAQQQEPALGARDGKGRVHHRASTSSTENEVCSVRATSSIARSFARFPPTPCGAGAVPRRRAHLFHQALQLFAVQGEHQAGRNRLHAELDAVASSAASVARELACR